MSSRQTVTISFGKDSAAFRLVQNKLQLTSVASRFGINESTLELGGIVEPKQENGLTFSTFADGEKLEASGRIAGTLHECIPARKHVGQLQRIGRIHPCPSAIHDLFSAQLLPTL